MAEPEFFDCVLMRDDVRETVKTEGVRVSAHFAHVVGQLTHIPSGYAVPYSQCSKIWDAKNRANCLEALSYIDWGTKEPAAVELTEEQHGYLRAAAQGVMPPTEFRRAECAQ